MEETGVFVEAEPEDKIEDTDSLLLTLTLIRNGGHSLDGPPTFPLLEDF